MMMERTEPDPTTGRSRKRVNQLRSIYIHLAIYLVVNIGLFALDLAQGDGLQWAQWVALGWGIGLAAHAVIVFVFEPRWDANNQTKMTNPHQPHPRGT
jgi:hypothetical protein